VQLRIVRQRRRCNVPTPRHIEEVPPPVEEEPQELEENNMVGETGVGVTNLESVIEFQQLSQSMWT
jgi:hypothetical protein